MLLHIVHLLSTNATLG